jgi:hypothetical protein
LLSRINLKVNNSDFCAQGRELFTQSLADAITTPGNNHYFIIKFQLVTPL